MALGRNKKIKTHTLLGGYGGYTPLFQGLQVATKPPIIQNTQKRRHKKNPT
jgi:hypothetical protein